MNSLPVLKEDPDPFTPEERNALLAACDHPQLRNLFQFAFWSGLRTGELIALEWGDIDWHRNLVRVCRASVRKQVKAPKTKAGIRDVLLLAPALEALQSQRAFTELKSARVFENPRTGTPWETDGQIRKTAWQRIIKRARVRYRYPYQTRHTYASTLLSTGENPMWVASQMGHADWGMIRERYGRWIPAVDAQAGGKISALIAADHCDQTATKRDQV